MSRAANKLRTDHDRKASSMEEVRVSVDEEEEVRRKPGVRRGGSAGPGKCGVKTIASVLDAADEQLRISREFAENLAKRR